MTAEGINVRPMAPSDWDAVRVIYAEGIATGDATFERQPPERQAWEAAHLPACRLVAEENGLVVGWAALAPVSSRSVYAGVAEVGVYVAAAARGRGAGMRLLRALLEESERQGIWTLQVAVFPENDASLRLHRACGFRLVGRRERLGRMEGRWRDVLLLERRSSLTGI
jgi:phosphinothricin acetyltransferase